jgi:hypothetical protein
MGKEGEDAEADVIIEISKLLAGEGRAAVFEKLASYTPFQLLFMKIFVVWRTARCASAAAAVCPPPLLPQPGPQPRPSSPLPPSGPLCRT